MQVSSDRLTRLIDIGKFLRKNPLHSGGCLITLMRFFFFSMARRQSCSWQELGFFGWWLLFCRGYEYPCCPTERGGRTKSAVLDGCPSVRLSMWRPIARCMYFSWKQPLPAAASSSSARSYIGICLFVAIMWSIIARLTSRLHISNFMVSFLILVSMP